MRIGVISDTHIPVKTNRLPQEALDGLKGVDMIIHAGDLVELSVLESLKKICPKIVAVAGNMDNSQVHQKLPGKQIVETGKFKIGVMHGNGAPNRLIEMMKNEFKKDKVDIIIFGHSHTPENKKIDGILFFNPGSLTDKDFAPYNSYGILELNDEIEAKIIRI